ncbi:hypothetical protein OsccyDRAFT_0544 [Leptolyngbyaceae cyanobacterium JSC-12]|nr:hypothetical protein OsccyDRAFT_0544 [Leptolyngbyaceae cyanobacterium JSC-12]
MAVFSVNVQEHYWHPFREEIGKGKTSKAIQLLVRAYLAGLINIDVDQELVATQAGVLDKENVLHEYSEPVTKSTTLPLMEETKHEVAEPLAVVEHYEPVLLQTDVSPHIGNYYNELRSAEPLEEEKKYNPGFALLPAVSSVQEESLTYKLLDDFEINVQVDQNKTPSIVVNEGVLFARNLCSVLHELKKESEYDLVKENLKTFLQDNDAEIPDNLLHPLNIAKVASREMGL